MTLTTQRIPISIPSRLLRPRRAQDERDTSCEALVWVDSGRALLLFIDIGRGESVTKVIDHLFAFVLEDYLRQEGITWQNVQMFARDTKGAFDQVEIEMYGGAGVCEANWIPMPSKVRTLDGFCKLACSRDFEITHGDMEIIRAVMRRTDALLQKAA